MSEEIINSHNVNCLETLGWKLYNIAYSFDMFINSDDFYVRPNDKETQDRFDACQQCISDTLKRLFDFEKEFKRYGECVREGIEYDG